jgi:hypothetical protein
MADERDRRRFTLRDLFALLTIIGVLLALSVPAIQVSRERARQDGCSNKLQQLGIALQNHQDVYNHFPPIAFQANLDGQANVGIMPGSGNSGTAAGFLADPGTASGYSWIVRTLPYLDETVLYGEIYQATNKFTLDGWSNTPDYQVMHNGVGRHFATIPLDAVSCPSYRGSTISTACSAIASIPASAGGYSLPATGYAPFYQPTTSPRCGVAITNYVALSATTSLNMPSMETADGAIRPGHGLNRLAIKDGTAWTLLLCETKESAFSSWYDGTTAWTTATPAGTSLTINSSGHPTVPEGGISSLNCGPWPTGTSSTPRLYAPSGYTTAGFSGQSGSIAWGPSSDHAGGVVMHLTCDGSVHSFTTDIDPTLYVQMVTRAGHDNANLADLQ